MQAPWQARSEPAIAVWKYTGTRREVRIRLRANFSEDCPCCLCSRGNPLASSVVHRVREEESERNVHAAKGAVITKALARQVLADTWY